MASWTSASGHVFFWASELFFLAAALFFWEALFCCFCFLRRLCLAYGDSGMFLNVRMLLGGDDVESVEVAHQRLCTIFVRGFDNGFSAGVEAACARYGRCGGEPRQQTNQENELHAV